MTFLAQLELHEPEVHELLFVLVGLVALGAVVLPRLAADRVVAFPAIFVGIGVVLFALPLGFEPRLPYEHGTVTEHLTEAWFVSALFALGLSVDRPFSLRGWSTTWRLLTVTLVGSAVAAWFLGWWAVGLAPATALLFAGAFVPTDPVQSTNLMHEPLEGEDEVRFSLSTEAGFSDALAFPIVNAAIAAAVAGGREWGDWIGEWALVDVLYRLAVAAVIGYVIGKAIGVVSFGIGRADSRLAKTGEGIVAVAGAAAAYGLTEVAEGYGFLAVFVAAQALRHQEAEHEFHEDLQQLTEQLERILLGVILVLFGGAIVAGVFEPLTAEMVVVAVVLTLVVRPLVAMLGLAGGPGTRAERLVIAFFGMRGIASFFYATHGLEEAEFEQAEELWALVALVVLISIVVHGFAAHPVVSRLERARE